LRPLLNKVYLTEEQGYCSTDILPLVANDKISNKILLWTLSSARFINYADSNSSGTKMPRTKWNDMKNYLIPLGKITEQQKIACILSNIDLSIQWQKGNKSKIQNLKKGLVQQLLTGKIRVKV
jgi:type I restriction enzyme, S subunit